MLNDLESVIKATPEEILETLDGLRTRLDITDRELKATREAEQSNVRKYNVAKRQLDDVAEVLIQHCEAAPDELQATGMAGWLALWLSANVPDRYRYEEVMRTAEIAQGEIDRLDHWLKKNFPKHSKFSSFPVLNVIRLVDTMHRGISGLADLAENSPSSPSGDIIRGMILQGTIRDKDITGKELAPPPLDPTGALPTQRRFPPDFLRDVNLTDHAREALAKILEKTRDRELDVICRAIVLFDYVINSKVGTGFTISPWPGERKWGFIRKV